MKLKSTLAICILLSLAGCRSQGNIVNNDSDPTDNKVVVAYVTSWSDIMPDPKYMTHINYAFGHVSETFDGVGIANPDRLAKIAQLKENAPDLKVLLSIGGWGSGRFSEMAADSLKRLSFAADCRKVVDQYGLDGIDIDWEYPTSNAAGMSSSPDDTSNFTKLMRDIRAAIGPDKQLTLATVDNANFIDFKGILPYIDFVNTMSYDMGNPPYLHSGLYDSRNTNGHTTDASVRAHLSAGVPPSMIVVGMPFYGRGHGPFHSFAEYGKMDKLPEGYSELWDDEAKVPYITDAEGNLVLGFENARSIAIKCDYVKDNGLRGAMYWEYSNDDENSTLRTTVADNILK